VALASLGDMLGDVRRTWYGDKVWDVTSMKNSKNIAYTNLDLGLHMDLV
jgi:gamma-butyrobetaine dioxygenase